MQSNELYILFYIALVFFVGGALCQVSLYRRLKEHPIPAEQATQNVSHAAWPLPLLLRFVLLNLSLGLLASLGISRLPALSTDLLNIIATYLMYGGVILLLLYFYRRYSLVPIPLRLTYPEAKKGHWILICYLAFMPILAITTMGYHAFLSTYFKIEIQPQEVLSIIQQSEGMVRYIYIITAIFTGPFFEELFFRGLLFPSLTHRFGFKKGLIYSALLFALIHLHIPALLPIFLLGILLNLLYWATGNLWSAIALHVLFNTVSIGIAQLNLV
jgi:membrane protease YdiL (CAAX protease family)